MVDYIGTNCPSYVFPSVWCFNIHTFTLIAIYLNDIFLWRGMCVKIIIFLPRHIPRHIFQLWLNSIKSTDN